MKDAGAQTQPPLTQGLGGQGCIKPRLIRQNSDTQTAYLDIGYYKDYCLVESAAAGDAVEVTLQLNESAFKRLTILHGLCHIT